MGVGGPDPFENHKFIGSPSNTGLDLLKITKLQSQHWQADNCPHLVVFGYQS